MGFTSDNPKRVSDVLKYDIPPYAREEVTVKSGAGVVQIGTVMGRNAVGAATPAAKSGGNTGNGVITMDVTTPVKSGARAGVYTARVITAAANGGTFRVEDPLGNVIGDVAVGATFDDDIKFVIADGATDFIVGDGFDITVASGLNTVVPLNMAGNDGAEIADCVLIGRVDATSGAKKSVAVSRHCELGAAGVIWPVGITDAQKVKAIAQLAAKGIIIRQSA